MAPSLKTPVRWYWSRDSDPESQGIRRGRSRIAEMSEKHLNLSRGRADLCAWTDFDNDDAAALLDGDADRAGPDDAAMRPCMTN